MSGSAMTVSVSADALRELIAIVGDGRYVQVKVDDRYVHGSDASIEWAEPQVVVYPGSPEEVRAVVAWAARHGLPVTPRGAGTGLSGGAVPSGGVLLVLTRLDQILEIDPRARVARVEPGAVNLELSEAAEPFGLFYAPDPSSQPACTIGGNLAENSGGPRCLAYGVTSNHVCRIRVVLADASEVELSAAPDPLGYDLVGLFVGSEGTLGVAVEAEVRLLRKPEAVRTLSVTFPEIALAAEAVNRVLLVGVRPVALEMMDRSTLDAVGQAFRQTVPREVKALLIAEVAGLQEEADWAAGLCRSIFAESGALAVELAATPQERDRLWQMRKRARGALGRLAPNYYVHDITVPRHALPAVLARIEAIGRERGLKMATYLHAGDGNLHPNILFDAREPGILQRVLAAGEEILALAVDVGGTLSGEHGIGLEKRDYLGLIFDEADLEAMRRVRRAFDPAGRFNPDKALPRPGICREVRPGVKGRVPEGKPAAQVGLDG
jgi:glycolate oxidase